MDGVFINLTNNEIELITENGKITIPSNADLATPIKEVVMTDNVINGILSTPLNEDDIRYLQTTKWVNTLYNKISRSEDNIQLTVSTISHYVKYPFTKEQVDKINQISNGRTRLLIVTKEDALYWSCGKFECPFRNYRLFTSNNGKLIEYPIPKTYLDLVVDGVKHVNITFLSKLT
jgi:hypothetical protein